MERPPWKEGIVSFASAGGGEGEEEEVLVVVVVSVRWSSASWHFLRPIVASPWTMVLVRVSLLDEHHDLPST